MWVRHLRLCNIRNLVDVTMAPSQEWNILYGDNGAGKTSVLEGLSMLGRGRSFLTARTEPLIRTGHESLTAFCRVVNSAGAEHSVGMERGHQTARLHLDGAKHRELSGVVRLVPLQVLTPRSHELVEGPAGRRREFLDWGVFHVEHAFQGAWQRYHKALRQRNASLRMAAAKVNVWDHELTSQAARIDRWRADYVSSFMPHFQRVVDELGLAPEVSVSYFRGWADGVELADRLREGTGEDRRRGYTSAGPHRADLRISVGKQRAALVISRGQQKLVVAALHLAQARVYAESRGETSIILLDDVASELDANKRLRLLEILGEMPVQTFISCIGANDVRVPATKDRRMFHVEHGRVTYGS